MNTAGQAALLGNAAVNRSHEEGGDLSGHLAGGPVKKSTHLQPLLVSHTLLSPRSTSLHPFLHITV